MLAKRFSVLLWLATAPLLAWTAAGVPAAPSGESDLAPGAPIEREIAPGEAHVYRFAAQAGRHLLITAGQDGADLTLKAGEEGAVDSLDDRQGPVSLLWSAETAGPVRLEVRARPRAGAPGRYTLRLEELPAATAADRRRLEAERAMTEAGRVLLQPPTTWQPALAAYERALPVWRQLGDRRQEARTLAALAGVRRTLDEIAPAHDLYLQVLALWRQLGERAFEADTLDRIGLCRARLGRYGEALEAFEAALALERGEGDRYAEALTLGNVGYTLLLQGEARDALPRFEQALALVRDLGETEREAAVLQNMGGAWDRLGEPQRAIEHYTRALALLRARGERRDEARVLNNLAVAWRNFGEPGKALEHYEQALAIIRELGDHLWEARTLNNLGYTYYSLGEPRRAVTLYEQTLGLRRQAGDRLGEAITLNNLGRAHERLGETDEALALYQQALALSREIGDRQEEATSLGLLGRVYAAAGDSARALESLDRSAAGLLAAGNRRGLASSLQQIGEIHTARGDFERAAASLGEALELRRALADRAGEAETLYALARLERRRGRLDEAWARAGEALGLVESLRIKLGSPDLRASYLASQRRLYELSIGLRMDMERREPGRGHAREALAMSERARARSLLELLQEAGTAAFAGVDPVLRERERSLRNRLNAKATYQLELLSGASTAGQREAAERDLAGLLAEVDQVEAEIRRRSPRYAALTQPQPLDAAGVQRLLDPGTLLLEYALGDERSYLWAVDPESVAAFELPGRQEIESAVREVYRGLRTLDVRPSREEAEADAAAGRTLSRLLLGPVADRLGEKRLVIVADAALQYIPFAALPAPGTADPGEPLLVRHEIVHLPSASVLAVQRRELAARPAAAGVVAVLADPVFQARDPRLGTAQATPAAVIAAAERGGAPALAFDRLPATRREAEAIAALAPAGQALTALDFRASRRTALSGDLGRYRIVHFATHGVINAETPELSGLVLSLFDERGVPQEGFLGLRDIYGLDLGADLVVLSGCETALGREVRGEGLSGLTRGFMYAGAARVMASLWRVEDRATSELMSRFYRALLAEGHRPAAALREAQLAVRAERRWRDPYYWAPFVLQGDWN
ncbi:MAG TPA: CHAT domain-containing tetratricopeptide repeat protein [Thermoanaerobaculia bacterium]|nr:CHAT domain-containing tetratricopeptide repeat protein [Thermoanaerobaculia bacterium]